MKERNFKAIRCNHYMHEILKTIHEVRPIWGLTVVRKAWMEPGKAGKKASIEVLFKPGSRDPPGGFTGGFVKSFAEKLRGQGATATIGGPVGLEIGVTIGKTQHTLSYSPRQSLLTIEPASQKIGFLQERRLKKAAAKLIKP